MSTLVDEARSYARRSTLNEQGLFNRLADRIEALEAERAWRPEVEAPEGVWLVTYLIGERVPALAMVRTLDGTREWIAPDGRTTVTHSTYAAPSHFLRVKLPPLPAPPAAREESQP